MPRVADLPCASCGAMMWRGARSLPEGQATCSSCRRADWQHGTRKGYRERGCRCDACRKWNVESVRAYSASRLARDGVSLRVQYRKKPYVHCADCGVKLKFGGGGTPVGIDPICTECARSKKKRWGTPIPRKLRLAIYERDGWVCQLCGESVERDAHPLSDWYPTVDHIVPFSKGGLDDAGNLRTAHRWCNSVRGADDRHADLFEEAL